jgi:hypothetical protein
MDTAQLSGTITKAELKMLEKIFTAEISRALIKSRFPFCFQSKAKVMQMLKDKGLVEPFSFKVGNDGLACTVEGWTLTDSGRFSYCANC